MINNYQLSVYPGYINDYGKLNLHHFEMYMRRLAELDLDNFREVSTDLQYLESKSGSRSKTLQAFEFDEAVGVSNGTQNGDLAALIGRTQEFVSHKK